MGIFVGVTVYKYAVEEKTSRKIRAMFSSYVTETVVSEMIANPSLAKLGGERREVTVLFADIKGFTTFSENHSSEYVVSALNEFLAEMTEIIFKWEGTLDKFIGDEIMAFWGAPMQQKNHAELAVKCAVNMVQSLGRLQAKWKAEGSPPLDCGIGINTGEVVVGNIGAEGKKMDYTVIGDSVNLGARVEALTREYNAHILVTEFTFSKIKDATENNFMGGPDSEAGSRNVIVRSIDNVVVKGREKPVNIYEIKPLK